jgi:hypothetical protein
MGTEDTDGHFEGILKHKTKHNINNSAEYQLFTLVCLADLGMRLLNIARD